MNTDSTSLKIAELKSMTGLKSTRPDLPVAVLVQEAHELFEWCKSDREALTLTRLDWKYPEELPLRAEVLLYLQASWAKEHLVRKDCYLKWKAALPQARNLRKELIHILCYALESKPSEYAKVKRCAAGKKNDQLIQSLIDLSVIGKNHQDELKGIMPDNSLLDKAWQMSFDLGKLQSEVSNTPKEISGGQTLRNKAYYHLKEAVEEVRKAGQYVFWKDKEKYKGYVSAFNQRRKQKTESRPEDLIPASAVR